MAVLISRIAAMPRIYHPTFGGVNITEMMPQYMAKRCIKKIWSYGGSNTVNLSASALGFRKTNKATGLPISEAVTIKVRDVPSTNP